MRVGICGCYDNRNYGSMLQAFANQSAVERLGHECEFVRYEKRYSVIECIRQVPRLFDINRITSIRKGQEARSLAKKYPEIQEARNIRNAAFDRFRDTTFTKLSDVFVGYKNLKQGSERYDVVQVGSDQLWLPIGLGTNFYNLQFAAPGVRRVSYSTSFGVSSIPRRQFHKTKDYLKRIDYLSVREESGAKIIKDVAGLDAQVVVDPTLLLSKAEWEEMVPKRDIVNKPYIFCYFLGKNSLCRSEARALSAATGYPVVVLRHLDEIIIEDEEFGDIAPYDTDPADFVNLIRGAEFVLTDSFHGSVFSILNHKKFVTFYRFSNESKQSRNSRIDNLLGHLDLMSRVAIDTGDAARILSEEIDYDRVDQSLSAWRLDSWDFLRRALA